MRKAALSQRMRQLLHARCALRAIAAVRMMALLECFGLHSLGQHGRQKHVYLALSLAEGQKGV